MVILKQRIYLQKDQSFHCFYLYETLIIRDQLHGSPVSYPNLLLVSNIHKSKKGALEDIHSN